MNNTTLAIIVSVLSLMIIIGFSVKIFLDYRRYKKLTEGSTFPPWPAQCPDYWEVKEGEDGEIVCKNINNIGICKGNGTDQIMDFNASPFKGGQGQLYKCSWSKKCKSPWEGVDNIC